MVMPSPAGINRKNKEFWISETAKAERRMADPDILQLATMNIESSTELLLPVYNRKSFEQALLDVDNAVNHHLAASVIHRRFSRRGGLATKTDALQQIILQIVEKEPSITEAELVEQLRAQRDGAIDDIDEVDISFRTHTGKVKTAPLSGLKDRLSRAKKALRSR